MTECLYSATHDINFLRVRPYIAVKCLGFTFVLISGLLMVLGPVYSYRDNQHKTPTAYPGADADARYDSGLRFYGGMFPGLAALAIGCYLLDLKQVQNHDQGVSHPMRCSESGMSIAVAIVASCGPGRCAWVVRP